jgi:ArsR family transcriptional regulator, arsenate/arsenite/antimonite-responsive transcriptional repressor
MRQLEAALKAAGDPTRTRILKLLEDRELCVCQIQAVLRLAPSTVSKHLALLKSAGLVEDRKQGRWIHYRLESSPDNPSARGVLTVIREALRRDPRIAEDRRRLRQVLRTPLAELCELPPARPIANSGRGQEARR